MNARYKEFLENQAAEARAAFYKAKADTLRELDKMTPQDAANYGAGYVAKIEQITAAAGRWKMAAEALSAYKGMEEQYVG